ncbi:hypothetical protein L3X38_026959 [Prunus dulcis]|uniref:Uncharacterized protein n=1 Tax=Prunus dulcis TaxID=3755 RepID=A0AAD4Z0P8_PRUDU|nr:hypothetical protein L3X38_026959 [Prunus dulcis]
MSDEEPIIFSPDNRHTSQPHNDPLVISVGIENCDINWVLIDGGSCSNIIFTPMLDHLGINRVLLNKKRPPLYAFGGTQVQSLSNIYLALTKEECPHGRQRCSCGLFDHLQRHLRPTRSHGARCQH